MLVGPEEVISAARCRPSFVGRGRRRLGYAAGLASGELWPTLLGTSALRTRWAASVKKPTATSEPGSTQAKVLPAFADSGGVRPVAASGGGVVSPPRRSRSQDGLTLARSAVPERANVR